MFVPCHQLVRKVITEEWSINNGATTLGCGSSNYQKVVQNALIEFVFTFLSRYQLQRIIPPSWYSVIYHNDVVCVCVCVCVLLLLPVLVILVILLLGSCLLSEYCSGDVYSGVGDILVIILKVSTKVMIRTILVGDILVILKLFTNLDRKLPYQADGSKYPLTSIGYE
jgi:hypothetical protein